jgi:hypothetical protein
MIEQKAYEKTPIEKTAATICDLAYFDTPTSRRMLAELEKKNGKLCSIAGDLAFLVAARHLTTRRLLDSLSADYQIVEMGAGFSPHGLNYSAKFAGYVEVDLPCNSADKKEVAGNLQERDLVTYISGDLFNPQTWNQVREKLDLAKPVFAFCEGVVSPYASEEQKTVLGTQLQGLFCHPDCKLYLDDTLKNHPDLEANPLISSRRKTIADCLKDTSYHSIASRTFEAEICGWDKRGFSVELVPYANVGDQYSSVTDVFRGMLCTKKAAESMDSIQLGFQAPEAVCVEQQKLSRYFS